MTREEYYREKELIALESIAESLSKIVSILENKKDCEGCKDCKDD